MGTHAESLPVDVPEVSTVVPSTCMIVLNVMLHCRVRFCFSRHNIPNIRTHCKSTQRHGRSLCLSQVVPSFMLCHLYQRLLLVHRSDMRPHVPGLPPPPILQYRLGYPALFQQLPKNNVGGSIQVHQRVKGARDQFVLIFAPDSSLHTCQSTFLLSHPCRRPARQRTARVRSSRREGGSLRRSPTWRVGGYRVLVDLMQHRCHWKTVTRQAHVLCGGCGKC